MLCHLHVHSHYSFFDSTLSPLEIAKLAAMRGFRAVALTDTHSLAGAVDFAEACREAGVIPVFGAEVDDPETGERVRILVRDAEGWRQLCRLISERLLRGQPEPALFRTLGGVWTKGGRAGPAVGGMGEREPLPDGPETEGEEEGSEEGGPPVAPELLARFCHAPFGGQAFRLRPALAALSPAHTVLLADSPSLLEFLSRLEGRGGGAFAFSFGGASPVRGPLPTLYAELILTRAHRMRARAAYECARSMRIPIVATRDVHFADAGDYELYRLLRAMARGTTLARLDWQKDNPQQGEAGAGGHVSRAPLPTPPTRASALGTVPAPLPGADHFFCDSDELRHAARGLEAEIERSMNAIVEACRFELPLGIWQMPVAPSRADDTAFSRLWKLAFAGLERRRRPVTREVVDRLRREMEIIDDLGFSDYFLVVHEIAEEARMRGLDVLGRGSAANSLVSHALGFTGVDPLRHHLYFERFLNPERRNPPDIDLDFSWKDRDALLDWVFERFGRDRVALISTTVRLQSRQAIREVAKALGMAGGQVTQFTSRIPGGWGSGREPLGTLDRSRPECRGLPLREEPWASILSHAERLRGAPAHYGIHCGGLVITPRPVWDYVPLVRAAKGFVVTQPDMRPIEELGLIKIDLLGNRSLGVLKDTLGQIASQGAEAGVAPAEPVSGSSQA